MLKEKGLKKKHLSPRPQATEFYSCTRPGLFALTFDDGPSYNGWTETVLDVLAQKQVKATFFVTGYGHDSRNLTDDVRKQALLRRIHQEGHEIASHTFTHDSLTDNRSKEDLIEDISNLANAVRDITGLTLTTLRPPYGVFNETVLNLIEEEFGYKVIIWNIDTFDWFNKEDIDSSFEAYIEALQFASRETDSFIALHHDPIVKSGVFASMAIDYVRSKGYEFVTVGECIGIS